MLWSSGERNTFDQECGHAYPKDYNTNKGIWEVYFQNQITEYLILNNGTDMIIILRYILALKLARRQQYKKQLLS